MQGKVHLGSEGGAVKDRREMTGKIAPLDAENFKRLTEDEVGFQKLSALLKTKTGIYMPVTPKNLTLMAARLAKVLPRFELHDYSEMYKNLQKDEPEILKAFIEAMTTNKTEFFRESQHFDYLPQALKDVMKTKSAQGTPREIRLWCAAASRGHEPYSILITILESGLDPAAWRLRFLASDIDKTVLETASKGVYKEDELKEIPAAIRSKYFNPLNAAGESGRFLVKEEYRSMISFAQVNLINFPYPFQHKFDIIFCRNVMIYFDPPTTQKVKEQLADALAPQGYLFIGHSETGSGRVPQLQSVESAVFKKTKEAS